MFIGGQHWKSVVDMIIKIRVVISKLVISEVSAFLMQSDIELYVCTVTIWDVIDKLSVIISFYCIINYFGIGNSIQLNPGNVSCYIVR